MTNPAFVTGWLYVPHDHLVSLEAAKHLLTVQPFRRGAPVQKPPVPVYDENGVPGHLGVPIDWGLTRLPKTLPIEDRTTLGGKLIAPRRPDPFHPNAAPGQDKFMLDLRAGVRANHAVLAIAPTGSGKTVTALDTAAEFQRSTVVMVPQENIMGQWYDEAKLHLGLTDDDIGIIQSDKCQYGRPLVLCMMHSLTLRTYPEACYRAFGMAIWDEVHRTGAPMLSQTLGKFTAASKIALTATEDRKDGADRIYKLYFGGASIRSDQEALPITVRCIRYKSFGEQWGTEHGSRVKCLTMDRERNRRIIALVKARYDQGRHCLIIGESIEHLEEIAAGVRALGALKNDVGQYTGQHTGEDGKRRKVSKEYLDWCKLHPRLIFATYGMMKEAVNIPRLNYGIDITPRADATQVIGRIRRPMVGKLKPIWDTIVDTANPAFMRYYKSRLKEYRSDTTVEIVDV